MSRVAIRWIAVAVLVGSIAAGCGGGKSTPQVCKDRDQLEQSLTKLRDLRPTDGLSAYADALDAVRADAQKVADSARSQFAPESEKVRASLSTLADAIREARSSDRPGVAIAAIGDAIREVGGRLDELTSAMKSTC
jgi:hypothetical protein